MGVSISWQPVSPKRHGIDGQSITVEALRRAFGDRDVLDQGDVQVLRGMAAAQVRGADELLVALEKNESIRLIFSY